MDIPQERKLITEIPGPKSRALFERRAAAIPPGVANIHPIVTARSSGAIVEDVDGNRLIDLATGISVLNVGHTAPEVVAAAQRQLELDTHTCFHVTANEPYIELAERLNALMPIDGPVKTMFANSGAEAVENAVKIARKATGRSAVVAFDHAFHGRTLMGMSLTAKVMPYKQGMGPFAPEVYRLPFAYAYRWPSGPERCAEEALAYAVDEMHKHIGEDNIACVVLEPIQGEGGFVVPAPGFVKGIAEFCAANGIVFIADEIQSGIGRAGRWFAIEAEDVRPDIVTSAKSLGGGLPISAISGRADLMDAVHVGGLGGTYGGNPVAAAAALAVLDLIERDALLDRASVVGDTIMARLRVLEERHPQVGEVRGRGAMCAMELVEDPHTKEPLAAGTMNRIAEGALEGGVIVLTAGTYGNVVRLLPPLTIEEPLLADGLDVLEGALGGHPPLLLLHGANCLTWLLGSIDSPARQAATPRLVGTALVPQATALNQVLFQTTGIVGPALAGLLIAATSPTAAYTVDLVSYAGLLLAALAMAPVPPEPSVSGVRPTGLPAVREGFTYVRRDRLIQSTFVIDLIAMIFGMPQALFPILAVTGGPKLGDLEAGLVAAAVSPTFSVISGGLACVVGAFACAAAYPELRRYEAPRTAVP